MSCEITLLRAFAVTVDGRALPVDGWRHRRATELVKILALAEGHRVHREQLMDLLWPELGLEAGAANLRKAVHFARRAFGTDEAIVVAGEMLSLWPKGAVLVDCERFETSARAALLSDDVEAAAGAAVLYTGELLPEDRYASWAEEPRDRLRVLALRVSKAASLWDRVLEIDPADEEAHRVLMQRALDDGDRTGAIRQFERLRERLRTDLGMGPDRDSIALYEKAVNLEGEAPPSASERARALLAWGLVHLNSGDLDEAERSAGEARLLAIDSGLGREIGEASALIGIAANMQGRWKELFREEFVESVRRSPELAAYVFDAHLCLAEFCLNGPTGHEEIAGYARELLAEAKDAGSTQGRALAELLLGEAALFSGRLDVAGIHLETSRRLHDEAGAAGGRIIATQRLAETAIAAGHGDEAERLLRRELGRAGTDALAPHLVVRLYGGLVEAARDVEDAVATLARADAALAGETVCPPCAMGFRVAATITLARATEVDRARMRLSEAERFAGMWPAGPWHAAVWEARAFVRRAEGTVDLASALFREAAERFAEVGRPLDAARCRAAAEA